MPRAELSSVHWYGERVGMMKFWSSRWCLARSPRSKRSSLRILGGALKLSVSLLCAQCGDSAHGWDGKCPVSRSAPEVCCRPFPQNLTIQAGPLGTKRRRLVGNGDQPEDSSAPSQESQSRSAEEAWLLWLKPWRDDRDAHSGSTGGNTGSSQADGQPGVLKLEDGGSRQITTEPQSHSSGGGWLPTVGCKCTLRDDKQPCTVLAVSKADGSARVRWVSSDGQECKAWVDVLRLSDR